MHLAGLPRSRNLEPPLHVFSVAVAGAFLSRCFHRHEEPLAGRPQRCGSFAAWETPQRHELPLKHCLDLRFAGIILISWRRANRERAGSCQLDTRRLETRTARSPHSDWLFLFACRIVTGHGRGWPGPRIIPRTIGAFRAIPRRLLPFRAPGAWRHLPRRLATGSPQLAPADTV
jgi:hypothetical protein